MHAPTILFFNAVIAGVESRIRHLALAYRILKPGGRLYVFIWSGCYPERIPERGSGVQDIDAARGTCQNNRWASEYLPEVRAVFGSGAAFVDASDSNLIVAVKSTGAFLGVGLVNLNAG